MLRSLTATVDSQGGRSVVPTTVATVWAELVSGTPEAERLQAQNMGSPVDYRFRIRARADVTATMQAQWTPRFPAGAPTIPLEVHNVIQEPTKRSLLLECGVRS